MIGIHKHSTRKRTTRTYAPVSELSTIDIVKVGNDLFQTVNDFIDRLDGQPPPNATALGQGEPLVEARRYGKRRKRSCVLGRGYLVELRKHSRTKKTSALSPRYLGLGLDVEPAVRSA